MILIYVRIKVFVKNKSEPPINLNFPWYQHENILARWMVQNNIVTVSLAQSIYFFHFSPSKWA